VTLEAGGLFADGIAGSADVKGDCDFRIWTVSWRSGKKKKKKKKNRNMDARGRRCRGRRRVLVVEERSSASNLVTSIWKARLRDGAGGERGEGLARMDESRF